MIEVPPNNHKNNGYQWGLLPPKLGNPADNPDKITRQGQYNMTDKCLQDAKLKQIYADLMSDVLVDRAPSGRVRPWAQKKERNMRLSEVYDELDPVKAARLRECGEFLAFGTTVEGRLRLDKANFCRLRLCPMCQWRKSLKAYSQMRKILDWCNERQQLRYIFCTLTVRNCEGEELAPTITNMMQAYNRLMGYAAIAGPRGGEPVVKGWYRSLEVTHDTDEIISQARYNDRRKYYDARGLGPGDANPGYDTYHPHYHVVWAVAPGYFNGRQYISQAKLTELWQRAARLDYTPSVDIRAVKGVTVDDVTDSGADSLCKMDKVSYDGAICELTKYATKDADYVIPGDWDLSVRSVGILDQALERRRLIARGGLFAAAFRALRLQEPEDGDLVHVDDDGDDEEYRTCADLVFVWHSGYNQYRRE